MPSPSMFVQSLGTALGVPPLVGRMIVEERTLLAQLPGYPEYARRVRWRLLPGLW